MPPVLTTKVLLTVAVRMDFQEMALIVQVWFVYQRQITESLHAFLPLLCWCIYPSFPDINECLLNPCHVNATCVDTIGSATCQCKNGFSGDGITCQGSFVKIVILAILIETCGLFSILVFAALSLTVDSIGDHSNKTSGCWKRDNYCCWYFLLAVVCLCACVVVLFSKYIIL